MDTELEFDFFFILLLIISILSMNAREPGEVCQISKQAHVPSYVTLLLCT
jgi:hypothetical protein